MKTKICRPTPIGIFPLFLVLLTAAAVDAFGQEGSADALQGTWFDNDRFIRMIFYNKYYETEIRGELTSRGEFTISGNRIIRIRTHTHSNAFHEETTRYGWFSREEAYVDFNGIFDGWFEPVTQTFSIDGDTLTLVSEFSVQQFTRIR